MIQGDRKWSYFVGHISLSRTVLRVCVDACDLEQSS